MPCLPPNYSTISGVLVVLVQLFVCVVCCVWGVVFVWGYICVGTLETLEVFVCKGFCAWFPLGTSQALGLLWPCSRFVLCATPLCAHSCCVFIGGGYPSDG